MPRETLLVPAINKANMLRGAFGHAFRQLCCIPQCRDARRCPLASSCPYRAIFEPSPAPDSERLSRNQDIPRPFVFRAPFSDKTKFERGEEFEFGLVLIGRAMEHLPFFVLSFREIAEHGMGLNRAKCELKRVEEAQPSCSLSSVPGHLIYDSADQVFHSARGLDLVQWLAERAPALLGNAQIVVRFLTPTLLKAENSVKRSPAEFHYLLKRLRDRINALSTFFGSGPLEVDFAGLGRRAEQVKTVSCKVQWEERFRTSSKTRQRHELSGFVGEAIYEGDVQEFLPWLALGELVHVGKHTAWGMGEVQLTQGEQVLQ